MEAINYIHSISLIHMDLKPKNIVFKTSSMMEIVLLDFGISKISRNDQDTPTIAMSYYYCSPEVKNDNSSKISQKSDIFSVGMFIDYFFLYIY